MKGRVKGWLRPHSFKTIALGATVASLAFLGQTDILSRISGAFKDKDVMVRWSSILSGATRQAIPVTIIDIDDATLERVGGGDRAPRVLIAQLTILAASKGAAGVMLDLDTSRASPDPVADKALVDAVASYPPNAPLLMYARRFTEAADKQPATELKLAPLPSILDGAAAKRENIISVSSVAPLDGDRVIRRWQLSQTLCEGGKGVSYASPQLVALALKERSEAPRLAVERFLEARNADACGGPGSAATWPRNPDMSASIWFLFGADPNNAPITMVESGGQSTPLVRHIPAATLLGTDGRVAPGRSISDQIFAGRIVVIGSSHLDSFDTHMTPLGPMPGAFIIGNTIASAPATLSAVRIPSFLQTLIAMAIFVLLAVLTKPLRALAAAAAVITAMIILLALLGRVMAPSSALTIAFTATALLALFSGLSSLYEIAEAWSRVGWRAILKNPPSARPAGEARAPAIKESEP
ncbi:MAG: CHASE2 domain-containing protein [Beijerinckiaceae bacterium]